MIDTLKMRSPEKYTKSWLFFLPMLEIPKRIIEPVVWDVYVGDASRPEIHESILILVNKGVLDPPDYEFSRRNFHKHPNYGTEYSPTSGFVMFTFGIPTDKMVDYRLLRQGLYSRISEPYKAFILAYFNQTKQDPLGKVLYRSESLYRKIEEDLDTTLPRNLELASVLDLKIELYHEPRD